MAHRTALRRLPARRACLTERLAGKAGPCRRLATGLALLSCLLLAQTRPAAGESDPHGLIQGLSLLVGAEAVFVDLRPVAGASAPRLRAEAQDAAGLVKARGSVLASTDGSAELRLSRGGLDAPPASLLPGDRLWLEAEYADGRRGGRDLIVPRLGVDLQPTERRLAGWAPPGEGVLLVTADARGGFASDSTVAGADGRWQVELGEDLDLGPGASGTLLYTDRTGVVFQAAWSRLALAAVAGAPDLQVHLRPGELARLSVLSPEGGLRLSGQVRGAGSPAQLLLRDAQGLLAGPRPGDRLLWSFSSPAPEVHPPRPPVESVWPGLDIAVDEAADSAQGQAPPGTRLSLEPEGRPLLRQEVVADAAGLWRADWSGRADLAPDRGLEVTWPDLRGFSLLARATDLEAVAGSQAELRGRGVAGQDLALRLLDGQGRTLGQSQTRVDAAGHFAAALRRADLLPGAGEATGQVTGAAAAKRAGEPGDEADLPSEVLPLAPGQTLQVLVGSPDRVGALVGQASRLDLQPVADADTELLGLPSLGDYRMRARLAGQAAWLEAAAGEAGVWFVDFAEQGGLAPGSRIELSLLDAAGVDRGLAFPVFRLSAFQDGGWLLVEGPPGLVVPIEQERAGKTLARGSCTVDASRRCVARLKDEAGAAPPLLPGDTVLAFPEAAASASLDLVKLTAHIDLSGRDVTGQAPPGRPVDIVFSGLTPADWPSNTRSATDPMGVYDYELNSSQWDLLRPGLVADVFLEASSGHRNAARGLLERLQLSWDGRARSRPGGIEADVEVGSNFAVEAFAVTDLDANGQPLPGRTPVAGYQGRDGGSGFNPLPDAAVRDLLTDGALLRLDHRRGRRELPVIDLAAWIMDEAGAVAGFTAPFHAVHVVYRLAGDAGDAARHLATTSSDAAGHFRVEPPPVSLLELAELRVAVSSGQGEVRRALATRRGGSAPHRALLPAVMAAP